MFRPDGRPCYIGRGSGNRVQIMKRRYNRYLQRIIDAAGGQIESRKIADNLTEIQANELERRWIRILGRSNTGGYLVNVTDGGEGIKGWKRPPGKPRTAAEIASKPIIQKGIPKSPTQRARQSQAHKDVPLSRAHALAIGAAHLGKRRSEETRRRMSESNRHGETCTQGHMDWGLKMGKRGYPNRTCLTCKRERNVAYQRAHTKLALGIPYKPPGRPRAEIKF